MVGEEGGGEGNGGMGRGLGVCRRDERDVKAREKKAVHTIGVPFTRKVQPPLPPTTKKSPEQLSTSDHIAKKIYSRYTIIIVEISEAYYDSLFWGGGPYRGPKIGDLGVKG